MKNYIHEIVKIIMFSLLISLFIPFSNAIAGFNFIGNVTMESANGWGFPTNFSCSEVSDWSLTSTNCDGGSNCLRRNQGTSFSLAQCHIRQNKFIQEAGKSYIIQGKFKDEAVGNNGGYPLMGFFLNNTGLTGKKQVLGFQCESARAVFINSSGTSVNNFQSTTLPTPAGTCASLNKWVTIIFNTTSNKIGMTIHSDSTKLTQYYKNLSIMNYVYNGGYLSFIGGRNYNYDSIEVYESASSLNIKSDLRNISNFNNDTFITRFNVSQSFSTINSTNCSLYINGVKNQSKNYIYTPPSPSVSSKQNFTLNIGVVEADLLLNIFCKNANSLQSNLNTTTSTYKLKVDKIPPQLEILTNLINNSNYVQNTILNTEANITDSNLFAYNITLFYNSTILDNVFVENLSSTPFVSIDDATSLISIGNYIYYVQAWDSHTSKEIKPYKIDLLTNGIEIEDKIKIYSDDVKTFNTEKLKDRYSFEVEFNKGKNFKKLIVESNNNLYYLENSEYKGHLVDFKNKKWIDFSGNYEDITFKKINEKSFEVTIKDSKKDTIKFNSIGDLNYNNAKYYFSVYATPTPTPTSNATNINLSGIETQLNNLSKELSFLWIVVLYLGLMFFGLTIIRSGNLLTGTGLLLMSFPLDILIVIKIINEFMLPYFSTSWDGRLYVIGSAIMGLWIFIKLAFIIFSKYSQNSIKKG
jgi:hypothetical protein